MPGFEYQIGRFTGTTANLVMNETSAAEWNHHFLLRTAQIEPEPPNWAMQVGSHMEPLMLDWFEQKLGHPITRRGEVVFHPQVENVCCKLDGYCAAIDAVIECKFLSPARRREEFIPAYYPQTTLQRLCTGAKQAILLVAQGTAEPLDFEHDFYPEYAAELMVRAGIFLECLRTLTPPFPMPPVIPPEKWRTLDIDSEPTNWSGELMLYLAEYDATAISAQLHDEMGKAARDLVPDDVGKVYAGAFQITRNRKGNLAITRRAA